MHLYIQRTLKAGSRHLVWHSTNYLKRVTRWKVLFFYLHFFLLLLLFLSSSVFSLPLKGLPAGQTETTMLYYGQICTISTLMATTLWIQVRIQVYNLPSSLPPPSLPLSSSFLFSSIFFWRHGGGFVYLFVNIYLYLCSLFN